jgi:hypothetical protein
MMVADDLADATAGAYHVYDDSSTLVFGCEIGQHHYELLEIGKRADLQP